MKTGRTCKKHQRHETLTFGYKVFKTKLNLKEIRTMNCPILESMTVLIEKV